MKGLGVNKLPAEAVKYYKKAAEQGDAEAQYLFATCLFTGNAVTQNVKQAVEYYQKSAQQEYMKAINDLGVCYARGIGVPKDGREALAHLGQRVKAILASMWQTAIGPIAIRMALVWKRISTARMCSISWQKLRKMRAE